MQAIDGNVRGVDKQRIPVCPFTRAGNRIPANCIGSRCMAWVEDDASGTFPVGHCGLVDNKKIAGKKAAKD